MDCTQTMLLINAWLDGESASPAESAALEGHLAACSECRTAAEQLRLQDADLRRAFAAPRQRAAEVARSVIANLDPPTPVRSSRIAWPLLLAATVAGYLIAIMTWRPGPKQEELAMRTQAEPVGRLAMATGPVEVQPPQKLTWFACPADTELAAGAALRTEAGTRCEIATGDGSQVRLNGDTQAQFHGVRQVALERGQLWSQVAGGEAPFCVTAPDAKILAGKGRINLSCQPGQTVVTVVDGSARVESNNGTTRLVAGQSAQIVEGRLAEVRTSDPLLTTAWINELLATKGPDDPEFRDRMNDILAQLGQAKMSYLYEEEIRRLGDNCVLPIVRYLESSRSQDDEPKRLRAAAIVADVAQPRSIGLLIELLADSNPQVRAHAARGLQRLTARDFGRPPPQWEADNWASCAPTYKTWQEWWEKNRDRYPAQIGSTTVPTKKS